MMDNRRMRSLKDAALRATLAASVLATVSGCGLKALLPAASEPNRSELAEWHHQKLLTKTLAVLPAEVIDTLGADRQAAAARFVTRVLETAPDGEARHLRSADRKVHLAILPIATTVTAGRICRSAELTVEYDGTPHRYRLDACRHDNGIWTR